MTQKFLLSSHPNISAIALSDSLGDDDTQLDFELGLTIGPVFLLVDISGLHTAIPHECVRRIQQGSLSHRNIAHLALYSPDPRAQFALLLAAHYAVTPRRFSIHQSYNDAMAYLEECEEESAGAKLIQKNLKKAI